MGSANTASIDVIHGALRFDRGLIVGPVLGTGLILASALVASIPFTHMSHFKGKYFTWHAVRWDDWRHERGSAMEARMAESLKYRPPWAAAHIDGDGSTYNGAEIFWWRMSSRPDRSGRASFRVLVFLMRQ